MVPFSAFLTPSITLRVAIQGRFRMQINLNSHQQLQEEMMKRKRLPGFVIALAVVFTVIFSFTPAPAAEFTADIVITGPGDNYTFKLYVQDNMYRLQKVKGPMNMPPYPTIVNRDTAVTWGLNPQMRQYVEMTDIEKTIMMNPLVGWAATRNNFPKKAGPTETLNGYECKTWIYTESGKSETAAKVWFSEKLGHIVREERFGLNKNPVLELQDIQEGPVDPALFEIPEGYTKLDMDVARGAKPSGDAPKKIDTVSAGPMKPKVETIEVKKGSGRGRSLRPDRRIVITATGDNPAGTISKAGLTVKDKSQNTIESARFALKNNQSRSWEIPPEMEPWTLSLNGEEGRIVFKVEQFAAETQTAPAQTQTAGAQATPNPAPVPAPASSSAQAPTNATPAQASSGNLMFILDASGSMWGQVEGKAKIAIAKEVLTGLIKDLPDDAVVGLVAYGHRRKGDCNDVEELDPLGKIDKNKLTKTIQGLSPKGKTPISRSVRMTAERIKHLEDETTIILVSDGKETCDPDPCGLVKDLKAAGIKFVMHVIGFDVTEEEKAQLECMAQAGGGEYFTAKNAKDFQMAAKEVVKKASEKPPVSLEVTCIKDEKPIKAYVQVLTQGGEKQVADGWSSTEKPALFRLPPGMYDIRAQDQGVIQRPTVDINDVEIVEGQTTERIANFATEGILHVKAIKENAPMKAFVQVHRQEDNKHMRDSWTREDGTPAEFKLLPGLYKIRLQDQSVTQRPVIRIENVEVKPGETVERVATFGVGGILHVKAIKSNAPCKTFVQVFRQEDNKHMRDSWTREDGKPAEFKLLPGLYKISLQDQNVTQRPVIRIENVEVKPGETVERVATFGAGGILHVKAIKSNAPCKTFVQVFRQEDNKYMGDGWTREDGRPAEYKLLPGLYKISLQDRSVTQRPVIRIENVEVKANQTVERVATFGAGGILQVKAVKNNAPAKTLVQVFRQEDNKYMGDGWTREDGRPAEFKLLPGLYKISLQDRSVTQRPVIWIENVEVKADQTVERFATFVEGGVLKVTATKDGAPYKAYVKIYQQQDDKYMGDGWAREDGRAAEYKLLPGAYYAKVEDRKDRSLREIRDIQVQSGKTTTVNAAFPVE